MNLAPMHNLNQPRRCWEDLYTAPGSQGRRIISREANRLLCGNPSKTPVDHVNFTVASIYICAGILENSPLVTLSLVVGFTAIHGIR